MHIGENCDRDHDGHHDDNYEDHCIHHYEDYDNHELSQGWPIDHLQLGDRPLICETNHLFRGFHSSSPEWGEELWSETKQGKTLNLLKNHDYGQNLAPGHLLVCI